MLIKFLSNGVEQQCENAVGRGFIAAGLAEEVKKAPPAPLVPGWSVIYDESKYVAIKMELGFLGSGALVRSNGKDRLGPHLISATVPIAQTVAYFHGDPDKIHDRRDHTGQAYCSSFGRPVPVKVIEQYRAARRRNPKACAPLMPYRVMEHEGNAAMAKTLKNRDVYKPVVTEHEALESQGRDSLPVIVVPLK
jgi:hypothetical protein